MTDEEIIEAYLSAYKAANGHRDITLKREGGWFYLGSGGLRRPYRRKKIQEMTQVLLKRVGEE